MKLQPDDLLTLVELRRAVIAHYDLAPGVPTPRTVCRWVEDGVYGILLPHRRVGKRRYVRWGDYLAWQAAVDERGRANRMLPAGVD